MTENIDQLVAHINQGIGEAGKLLQEDKVPDFTILDRKITEFSASLDNLPPEQAKEYAPLLKTWAGEIRKVSDKLGIIKDQVAEQISGAEIGGKATGAYGATSKLIKPQN